MSTLEALPRIEPAEGLVAAWTERYTGALMNTFGPPKRVLVRGEGCHVWDATASGTWTCCPGWR